jgi:putative ABC transport system permease protein
VVWARDWGVHTSQPVIGPALIVVCVVMVGAAALVYRLAALGSVWIVPRAALCWRRR